MILSEIKLNCTKQQGANPYQQILVCCDNESCHKQYSISLSSRKICFKKYFKDLCRGCQQKEQIKAGIRGKQYTNAGKASIRNMKGKTYEDLYGSLKCEKIKSQLSSSLSGEHNPMYGRNDQCSGIIQYGQKGKGISFDERYGKEKSKKIKDKISIHSAGENNNMFGKPAPPGSGNGWSGWYKEWYFRSLHELSYMINVIERFNFKWKSAETNKFKIPYFGVKGEKRTYVADFLINEKYLVEIKPKKLHGSRIVQLKKEAAINFCNNKGLIYKLTYPPKLLSYLDIKRLIDNKNLQFVERYKEKFNNSIIA